MSLFARAREPRVRPEDGEIPLARLRWLLRTAPTEDGEAGAPAAARHHDDGVRWDDPVPAVQRVPDTRAERAEGPEGPERPERPERLESVDHAAHADAAEPAPDHAVPPSGRVRSSPVRPSLAAAVWTWTVEHAPAALRGAALDPGRPGVRALAVLGIVAALVAAMFFWRSRPAAVPAPPTPTPAQVSLAASATPTPAAVVVHVDGKVHEPGVYTLPAGSRVVDAVRAAGGARRGADTGSLNLARRLVDGEQILVGVLAPAPSAAPSAAVSGPEAAGDSAPQLDLNTATIEQLEELPGIGPVLAERIVDYRDEHGGFRSVDQLQDVSGIGPKRFADIKDKVRV
ncbi:MAG: ComEA family DNA-binding protein [Streptosporangiales bacterium]|nr:ComEA family DNA-binding protein [Streptosporangiales bacterium]